MLNNIKNSLVNKFSGLSTVDKVKISLGACIPAAYFTKYMPIPQIQYGISSVFSFLNPFRFYNPNYELAKSLLTYPLYYGLAPVASFAAYKLTEGFEEADLQVRNDGIPNRDNSNLFALAKAGALLPAAAAITSAYPPVLCSLLAVKGLGDWLFAKQKSSKTLGIAEMGLGLFTLLLGTTICEAGFAYLYVVGPVIAGLSIVAAEILSGLDAGTYKEKIENHINLIPNNFMDNPALLSQLSNRTKADSQLIKKTLKFQHNMFAGNAHINNLGEIAKTLNSAAASILFFEMIGFDPEPQGIREMSKVFANNVIFNQNHISDAQLKSLTKSVKQGVIPNLDGVSAEEMSIIREQFTLARATILTNRQESAKERAL